MTQIFALRQRLVDAKKAAQSILDKAKLEGRSLTSAEQENLSKLKLGMESTNEAIIAEEKVLAAMANVPLSACHHVGDGNGTTRQHGKLAPGVVMSSKPRPIIGLKSWAQLWGGQSDGTGNGGFDSFDEYLHAVANARQFADGRLRASMTDGNLTQTGFLVPETWAQMVLDIALEQALCMKRCQVWPMSSSTLKVPGIKDFDHSAGTLFGGVTAQWMDELQTFNDQNLKAFLITLTARKLGLLANASSELLEDGINYEGLLTSKLQAAAEWFLDQAFLFGDGADRPQGMLHSSNPALNVVTHASDSPTNGIGLNDILLMWGAMAPSCRMRSTWVFSDGLIPFVYKLQLTVKNVAGTENVGGSATPLFTPDGNGGTLLGRPVIFSEKMKTAGSQGDAALICFDQYAIGMRRAISLLRSDQAGFTNDSIFWRLTTRVDGQSTWAQKQTLADGDVVSPFCVLTAR